MLDVIRPAREPAGYVSERLPSSTAVNNDHQAEGGSLAAPAPLFSWQGGNCFHLLADGKCFFPRMLATVDAAERTILLEMYLMESGPVATRFIDALIHAAERDVEVFLLLDDFGSRGLNSQDRQRLADNRVQVTWYNPLQFWRFRRYLSRDHRKLLLVDGQIAFTGGFGITDDFDPAPPRQLPWRETVVEIRGPVVAQWRQLFTETWNGWARLPLIDPSTSRPAVAGDSLGRVHASHSLHPFSFSDDLVRRVLQALRRVWMATAYFIPSRRLRRALGRKARQGLDVRLLLPGPITDHPGVRFASQRYYARLLRDGVRIFEYQPRFMHSKLVLCDDQVAIGSSNFDRWNLRRNLEANQQINDPAVAAQLTRLFEADFAEAVEIDLEQWRIRPWHAYLRVWFWQRIERLLDRDE
jgi:phosphatidylserine/phosphatidylglycerophosphate/cardiolipin synthase-like enzyme